MADKQETSPQMKAGASQARRNSLLARRALHALGNFRGIAALAAVLLLGVIFSPRSGATGKLMFLTSRLHSDTLFENAEYGILAVGMTLVILTGGIDLSVGSVLGFAATLSSLLMIAYGWAPVPAIAVTVMAGALAGSINGFLISRFRVQPFVATLAMMVAARGAAKWISGGIKVQPGARETYVLQGDSPHFYTWMTSKVGGIGLEPATLLFIISIIVMLLVVRYTGFGRRLYAVGGNEEAARLSGIRVASVKIAAYVLCGITAALAGVSNAARLQLGDPEAGFTYELDAIAAVVIGGTSLVGGQGGMFFTLVGTLIIGYVNKILSINAVAEHFRLLAKGGIIVLAVLIQQRKKT
ncbi:MAG TPA: ABC transporter permease [Armatimonadota bacterium]|nr:ABC transporter permease [Armatimonadota bacterium]